MSQHSQKIDFSAIGIVRSPFHDKFGVPRQPGLTRKTEGVIKIYPDPDLKTALRSLEGFSHIWVIFVFHAHGAHSWKPSIRPPRLGGKTKVGVLASRSPHRPNPIGLSVVEIKNIDFNAVGGPEIAIRGHDLLDGTPVLDIKPYLPYADSIPDAKTGWASEDIRRYPVLFSDSAEDELRRRDPDGQRSLRDLIVEVLELDPRPAFQQRKFPITSPSAHGKKYGFDVFGIDIQYEIRNNSFFVFNIRDFDLK